VAIADDERMALREFYERHQPWLAVRLGRRCSDPGIVAETVQDTFVAVWRGASSYEGRGDVGAWVWGIAVRRLLGRLRKHSWPVASAFAAHGSERAVGTASLSAEEQVLVGVEHGDLAGALRRLSPELRAVVEATVLDGLTTREAGRLLGIPAGTVKTRMMRARVELRGALT
jgi:RNA polymerase sigma-70 factor, ECF subfamily